MTCIVSPHLLPKNAKLHTPVCTSSYQVSLFDTHTLLSCLGRVIRLNSYTLQSGECFLTLRTHTPAPTDRECITMPAGGVVARFLPSDARFWSCRACGVGAEARLAVRMLLSRRFRSSCAPLSLWPPLYERMYF